MKVELSLRRPAGLLFRAARRVHWVRSEEGGSLVEFAALLPLLLVILAMAASFTLAFYNLQQLESATASAAALIAAEQGVTTDPCNLAMTTVQASLPGWTAGNLTYNLTISGDTGTATAYPSSSNGGSTAYSCKAAGSTGAASTAEYPNTPVILTVSYSYSWIPIPTINPFGSLTPSSALTASSSMMAD
jgi:Flp pilus assembly protein TadG